MHLVPCAIADGLPEDATIHLVLNPYVLASRAEQADRSKPATPASSGSHSGDATGTAASSAELPHPTGESDLEAYSPEGGVFGDETDDEGHGVGDVDGSIALESGPAATPTGEDVLTSPQCPPPSADPLVVKLNGQRAEGSASNPRRRRFPGISWFSSSRSQRSQRSQRLQQHL